MQKLISKFMALPIPGKAMIGMVAAGGIFGVCHLLGMNELGYFLGIAMAVVTVVLAIFGLIVEKRDKKKAANVEANIADSAAASRAREDSSRTRSSPRRRRASTGTSIATGRLIMVVVPPKRGVSSRRSRRHELSAERQNAM